MLVTKLEAVNSRKCRLYLNDEPAFVLYYSEVSGYHIREGEELSDGLKEQIYREVLAKRAKLRCMHLLKMMDKTEQQLRQKLRMDEYPAPVIDEAVEYVKSYHYVDDLRYAGNYIDSRKETKSRQQINCELQTKGVAKDVIELAWEEREPVDEIRQILHWAEKKHFDFHSADPKETQKFYQFLLRKGFLFSNIKKALT